MEKENIIKIEKGSKYYPDKLLSLKDAPDIIFAKGNVELLKECDISPCLGVVGTRRCTEYGKKATEYFVRELSKYFIIISGMARGIDSFAHITCIENNGKTIAVLGSGIDEKSIYPQENLKLARKIIEKQGLIISELPPGTKGARFTFPKRNRIIAALSDAILVAEAKEKSGAIITAKIAKDLKREVFAVPNSIFSVMSKGANNLIKDSAKIATNPNDILEKFNIERQNLASNESLSEEEKAIMEAIQNGADIDELAEKLKMQIPALLTFITRLEIKNMVEKIDNKYFPKNR